MSEMVKRSRIGFAYLGNDGEISVTLERGELVIAVRDKRFTNTRFAGVVIRDQQMIDLGSALIQLGRGTTIDEIEIRCANRETFIEDKEDR